MGLVTKRNQNCRLHKTACISIRGWRKAKVGAKKHPTSACFISSFLPSPPREYTCSLFPQKCIALALACETQRVNWRRFFFLHFIWSTKERLVVCMDMEKTRETPFRSECCHPKKRRKMVCWMTL